MDLKCWVFEKNERVNAGSEMPPATVPPAKVHRVRFSLFKDDRLLSYPGSFELEFTDEKAAAEFEVGATYDFSLARSG